MSNDYQPTGLDPIETDNAELLRILQDPYGSRWTAYAGRAPRDARAPFVAFWRAEPNIVGESMATNDFGRSVPRFTFNCFGASEDHAVAFRELLLRDCIWPQGWELDTVGAIVADEVDDPPLWFAPFAMRLTY